VLQQVGVARERLGIPVKAGWGLPRDAAPWTAAGTRVAALPSRVRDASPPLCVVSPITSRRDTGLTVLGFGMGVAVLMAVEVRGRLARGDQPRPLDLILPVLTLTAVFLIAAAVLSHKVRLQLSTESLSVEPRILGIRRKAFLIPRASIRGVFAVGPPGRPRHVLLETDAGPFAIRCGDREATEVASVIARAL
jgi:hypothetical protein